MNKVKRLFALLLASLTVGSLVACNGGGKEDEKQLDVSKTQLLVGNYNGGVGTKWLDALAQRFETEYAEYSFEEGKKGVQVWFDHDKSKYLGSTLAQNINSTDREVCFTQGASLFSFENNGEMQLLDLTDMVKSDLTAMGDTGTVEDKIVDNQKGFYTNNGKYYALPTYNGFLGLVYDVDLFDAKGLYFGADGKIGASLSDARASGPDGIADTYDDGLPATYEDFYTLCATMKKKSITPIIWSGQYRASYAGYLSSALYCDYEGVDKMSLQYNAGIGTEKNKADIVTEIKADGSVVTEEITISTDNYVELTKQPGRYYSLKVFEEIVGKKYYSTLSMDDAESHLMAQADYLESVLSNNRIGMMCEGSWWQSEAESVFDDMEAINEKYSETNRRFGFMPMPKQSAERAGKATLFDGTSAMAVIPANIDKNKIEVATTFLKFANTEQSLKEFTLITGGVRAMKYELSESEKQSVSYWTKNLLDMKNSSDVFYNSFVSAEARSFVTANSYTQLIQCYSKVNTLTETVIVNAMVHRNVTAAEYFKGYYEYFKN